MSRNAKMLHRMTTQPPTHEARIHSTALRTACLLGASGIQVTSSAPERRRRDSIVNFETEISSFNNLAKSKLILLDQLKGGNSFYTLIPIIIRL